MKKLVTKTCAYDVLENLKPAEWKNIPVVQANDPLIKDDCAWCGNPCDSPFTHVSKEHRYNQRGNSCLNCDRTRGVKKETALFTNPIR